MLGNLRLAGTGTVVEIQVTTTSMLRLKNSAAHGVYRIGRKLVVVPRYGEGGASGGGGLVRAAAMINAPSSIPPSLSFSSMAVR